MIFLAIGTCHIHAMMIPFQIIEQLPHLRFYPAAPRLPFQTIRLEKLTFLEGIIYSSLLFFR